MTSLVHEEPKGKHLAGATLVLGRPGLTIDVVTHTLVQSGRAVVCRPVPPLGVGQHIVVLADPTESDWVLALETHAPIVVVADVADDDAVVELLIRGAGAVVTADSPPEQLLDAVDVVAAGGSVIAPGPATAALRHLRENGPKTLVKTLTRRECEILASIERGESVKQTARALGISTKTVQNLQIGLYNKLRARNRAQAVARALEIGLL